MDLKAFWDNISNIWKFCIFIDISSSLIMRNFSNFIYIEKITIKELNFCFF